MLYRPMDGFGADPTTLVHALHDLALSINMAKKAGNRQAVNMLYDQFVQVAEEYKAQGGTERAILNLINSVHDAVIGTVQEFADVAGKTAANALNPLKSLILPLGLIAAVVLFGPALLKRRAT